MEISFFQAKPRQLTLLHVICIKVKVGKKHEKMKKKKV